ncbi:MAG: hypothetical protein K5894_15200 [Lachnospiraceae bacterium]|nr:hypothetical protein [Lachnospiraceae bacterium]
MQQNNEGIPITCDCGNIVAFERNGKVFIKCHRCHREIEITKTESRGH